MYLDCTYYICTLFDFAKKQYDIRNDNANDACLSLLIYFFVCYVFQPSVPIINWLMENIIIAIYHV